MKLGMRTGQTTPASNAWGPRGVEQVPVGGGHRSAADSCKHGGIPNPEVRLTMLSTNSQNARQADTDQNGGSGRSCALLSHLISLLSLRNPFPSWTGLGVAANLRPGAQTSDGVIFSEQTSAQWVLKAPVLSNNKIDLFRELLKVVEAQGAHCSVWLERLDLECGWIVFARNEHQNVGTVA